MAPSICIVDIDAHLDPDEVKRVAAALNRQVIEHVAPEWGVLASVRAGTTSYPSEWRLELRNHTTEMGEFGHHDETENGLPLMIVLVDVCQEAGVSWSSVASHEIIEAIVDPYLRKCVQMDDGGIFDLEACDRVETDSYSIDGVEVSNFNTPACFEPPRNLAGVKFDYLGLSTRPNEVRPGGYAQRFDPGLGWTQLGSQRAYRARLSELGLSRGIRRKAKGIIA